MFRNVLLVVLALTVVGGPTRHAEARKGDSVSPITNRIRKAFKADAKAAEKVLFGVATNMIRALDRGSVSAGGATDTWGRALAAYVAEIKRLADAAGEEAADDISVQMGIDADAQLKGGTAGDGGSFDKFADKMQGELSKLRSRALSRTRKVAKALAGEGGQNVRMYAVFPAWEFPRNRTPTPTGAVAPLDEPIRVWAALATRGGSTNDFEIHVHVMGTAPSDADGTFDLRVSDGGGELAIGDFLRDGGMPVNDDGAWAAEETLPAQLLGGNRTLLFGVEPEDGGSGLDLTRRVHAVTLALP